MTDKEDWVDIGSAEELARTPLRSCDARTIAIAISLRMNSSARRQLSATARRYNSQINGEIP
jgi:hypothetical protein